MSDRSIQLNQRLDQLFDKNIRYSQIKLQQQLLLLEHLLEQVVQEQEHIPHIYLKHSQSKMIKQLFQIEQGGLKAFKVNNGYRIPLNCVPSMTIYIEIVQSFNECIRETQAFIERQITFQGDGFKFDTLKTMFKDITIIMNRLKDGAFNLTELPALHQALQKFTVVNSSLSYLEELEPNTILSPQVACLTGNYLIKLSLLLFKKGYGSSGLKLFLKSKQLYQQSTSLETEEYFSYTKEMALYSYEIAYLILDNKHLFSNPQQLFNLVINQAFDAYGEILNYPLLFQEKLTLQQAYIARCHYLISLCWVTPQIGHALTAVNLMNGVEQLNEDYWHFSITKAKAFAVLYLRFKQPRLKQSANRAIQLARLVRHMQTDLFLKNDYVLNEVIEEEFYPLIA